MVSFSCENCGDVLTKKKLDPHRSRCRGATFTCIDCMVHFPGTDYRTHTSCMTEDQKYQGALYKGKKQKPQALVAEVVEAPEPATDSANMAHNAYVEDCNEVYESYQDYQVQDDFEGGFPPEAPTPPSALPHDDQVNVFDFMQQPTPNASNFDLPAPGVFPTTGGRQLVRFNDETDNDVDPEGYMVDTEDNERYGREQARAYETPIPKAARRKTKDGEVKKDKKRKRLHIDTSPPPATAADEVMTDAPPVLHSGLTGGLNRMMRPSQFPPSPDYSGADGDAHSPGPANPLKKSKEAKPPKATRTESFGSGLKALISGTSKPKATKKRKTKHIGDKKERKERKERKDKKERKEHREHKEPRKHHHHHHHSGAEDDKKPKLIEYRPQSRDESKEGEAGTMVLYKPRSDLFLSLCTKGPDSERGCSVNKALKRFHRERDSSTDSLGKFVEEKELWRSLRMRKNDRGEIVLFSIAVPEE